MEVQRQLDICLQPRSRQAHQILGRENESASCSDWPGKKYLLPATLNVVNFKFWSYGPLKRSYCMLNKA